MPSALVCSPRRGLVLSGWEPKEEHVFDAILEPSIEDLTAKPRLEGDGKSPGPDVPESDMELRPHRPHRIGDRSHPACTMPVQQQTSLNEPSGPPEPVAAQLAPASGTDMPHTRQKRQKLEPDEVTGNLNPLVCDTEAFRRTLATQTTFFRRTSSQVSSATVSSNPELDRTASKTAAQVVAEDVAQSPPTSPGRLPGRSMRPPELPCWPRRPHSPTVLPRPTRMYREAKVIPKTPKTEGRLVARSERRCGVQFRAGRRRRDLRAPQLEVNDDGTFDFPSARSWYAQPRFVKALSLKASKVRRSASPTSPPSLPVTMEQITGDGEEVSIRDRDESSGSHLSGRASRPTSASRAGVVSGESERASRLSFLRRRNNSTAGTEDGFRSSTSIGDKVGLQTGGMSPLRGDMPAPDGRAMLQIKADSESPSSSQTEAQSPTSANQSCRFPAVDMRSFLVGAADAASDFACERSRG